MLTVTPFSVKKDANKNHILPAKEEKEEVCHSLLDEDGEPHSEDQKHRDKCNICQSKVRHRDAMTNELCYVCIDTLKNQPFATRGHFGLVVLVLPTLRSMKTKANRVGAVIDKISLVD